ncbi:hypothetical protein AWJ20_2341 [Sugiyamaella lignohabitans]|uniref:Anhydro-N-acetylmuramic acid kinase n=1 Tax=Sugiyamaella lignohabitans TaxID=796027 RepID=A0A167F2C3_9ASCO|nr:uncharacterized protein AWJ20_2341 [Sugiyamaella lignohabitans]ANB14734.1 hypothetical protein AWJ20_2341 [Sugiyamaella lignohabitans]
MTISLPENMANPLNLSVIGLNSGTSMDSVDIVLCRFKQDDPASPLHLQLVLYDEMPMPVDLKNRVLRLIRDNESSPEELSQVNVQLGITFADATTAFCKKHDINLKSEIDLVASHGQTIWYVSNPGPDQTKSVLTMAEGAYIAQKLSKTVVSDFRISEQSVGRQGAPMIAFFDGLLLAHPTKMRICQNIGGIANSCFIPPESAGGLDKIFDFDNGPGNIFIDAAMRHFTDGQMEYDVDGEWGKKGTADEEMVANFLENESYFKRALPKTTGRELFGDGVSIGLIEEGLRRGLSKYDIIATITRITAQAIVNDYNRFGAGLPPIDELYLCGGGAHNPNIVNYIQQSFPNLKILPLSITGIPGGAKEAVTFAFQGLEAILGRPLIIPDRVENKVPVVVGKVTPGPNYRKLQAVSSNYGINYEDDYLPPVRKLIIDKE